MNIPPFPRWLRFLAISSVVIAVVLLAFGEIVTTLRAGMADPEWPTRPWHLALESQEKWTAGYLVEHTHRIIGFLLGGVVSAMVLGAWSREPRKSVQMVMLVSLFATLAGFGWFHGQMMAQKDAVELKLPVPSTLATVVPLAISLLVAFGSIRHGVAGSGVRAFTVVVLSMVMFQGLMGGLRVRLDQLVGVELSMTHGTFATIVFSALLAIPLLMAAAPAMPLPAASRRKLGWQTTTLVILTLMQIAFGAWVRHNPDRMASRMHLLFAFAVVGFATLVIKQALIDGPTRERMKWPARVMMALIMVQLLFGVEAWMGKFMTTQAFDPTKAPPIGQTIIRTVHAHVGAWILAIGVWFAIRSRRMSTAEVGPDAASHVQYSDAATPALVG